MQITILHGKPLIEQGSIRIPIDPTIQKELIKNIPYEIVIKPPEWIPDLIEQIIAKVIEVLGVIFGNEVHCYKEGDFLVIQVRRRGNIPPITPLQVLATLFPALNPFNVIPLVMGIRLQVAGLGLIAASALTFIFASGVWKALSLPLFFGGVYLVAKSFIN